MGERSILSRRRIQTAGYSRQKPRHGVTRVIPTIHHDLSNYKRGEVKCVNIAASTARERNGISR